MDKEELIARFISIHALREGGDLDRAPSMHQA